MIEESCATSIPCQFGIALLPLDPCPALRPRGNPRRAPADLAVLETTDLHSNVVGYDYSSWPPSPRSGLDRTAR
jgi:2',3'-cyclic-nucleotide 2'-phosphodiesterase/3'-nucleotidase